MPWPVKLTVTAHDLPAGEHQPGEAREHGQAAHYQQAARWNTPHRRRLDHATEHEEYAVDYQLLRPDAHEHERVLL